MVSSVHMGLVIWLSFLEGYLVYRYRRLTRRFKSRSNARLTYWRRYRLLKSYHYKRDRLLTTFLYVRVLRPFITIAFGCYEWVIHARLPLWCTIGDFVCIALELVLIERYRRNRRAQRVRRIRFIARRIFFLHTSLPPLNVTPRPFELDFERSKIVVSA